MIISTSMGHILAPGAGFDPRSVVRDPPAISAQGHTARAGNAKPSSGKYEKMRWVEYGQSKWCDIALARRLHWVHGPSEGRRKKRVEAEQIGDGELISIAVHPGRSTRVFRKEAHAE